MNQARRSHPLDGTSGLMSIPFVKARSVGVLRQHRRTWNHLKLPDLGPEVALAFAPIGAWPTIAIEGRNSSSTTCYNAPV